jgi:glycosyltransferase involved in cell wall biosynthesis
MRQTDYLAIHAAELDRYFPELCHLRNRLARTPFPVTCTPHTLCYWSTQVRNLYKVLPGPKAYDSIFCTSQAARTHLEQSFSGMAEGLQGLGLTRAGYAGRLDVSPLGVRTADFAGLDQAQARAQLGLASGVFTVLCLGRLTASDKFDLAPLVGAMALLNRRLPARLVLAGAEHQGYGRSLVELGNSLGLEDRITLLADFHSALKPAILAAADVFVSPADNLQETFGLALIEAMAAGLPVVAGDFSGYRDLVEDGVTGFLLPSLGPSDFGPINGLYTVLAEHVATLQAAQRTVLDMEALVERLALLARDHELRLGMGRAGQRRAQSRFDWTVVVRGMEALWDELKAQALAAEPTDLEPDVMGFGLERSFGHFVSASLGPEARLRPGPLAEEFRRGIWARQPHHDLAGALGTQSLEAALAALTRLGGQASPSQIGAEMGPGIPACQVEHLLLWGLKYGLLAKV